MYINRLTYFSQLLSYRPFLGINANLKMSHPITTQIYQFTPLPLLPPHSISLCLSLCAALAGRMSTKTAISISLYKIYPGNIFCDHSLSIIASISLFCCSIAS